MLLYEPLFGFMVTNGWSYNIKSVVLYDFKWRWNGSVLFNVRATWCMGSELWGNILESTSPGAEHQLLHHIPRPVRGVSTSTCQCWMLAIVSPSMFPANYVFGMRVNTCINFRSIIVAMGSEDSQLDGGCVRSWFSAMPLDFCVCRFPPSNTC